MPIDTIYIMEDSFEKYVRAICKMAGFPCANIQPLAGGQVNETFVVDDRFVVRVGREESARPRFERENRLYQMLDGRVPVPELLASGTHEGMPFQIQPFIIGRPLHRVWPSLSAESQRKLIDQLAGYLKAIHAFTFEHFGPFQDNRERDWYEHVSNWFAWSMQLAAEGPQPLPQPLLSEIQSFFDQHKACLHGGTPTLVHSDMWFGNVLVDGETITALIDFEYAKQSALDYELTLIEHFCLFPNNFAEADNEIYCTADFAAAMPLLQAAYPKLFDVPNLRTRLDIYQIIYCLNVHNSLQGDRYYTDPLMIIAKIYNFLNPAGARAFV